MAMTYEQLLSESSNMIIIHYTRYNWRTLTGEWTRRLHNPFDLNLRTLHQWPLLIADPTSLEILVRCLQGFHERRPGLAPCNHGRMWMMRKDYTVFRTWF